MIDPDKFTVRPTSPFDDVWLFKITGDPEATRYMGFRTHQTIDDARQMLSDYETSPSTFLAVTLCDEPGQLLGVIGYEVKGHQATLSVKLNQHDRRVRGATRLICKPFLRALLMQPNIWRVWSFVHVDNIVSQRTTEKCGAKWESTARRFAMFPNLSDEPQNCRIYAMTKEDL